MDFCGVCENGRFGGDCLTCGGRFTTKHGEDRIEAGAIDKWLDSMSEVWYAEDTEVKERLNVYVKRRSQ